MKNKKAHRSSAVVYVLIIWASAQQALFAGLFDTNLIVNGNAEAGLGSLDGGLVASVPGWTTNGTFTAVHYGAGGGFPTPTDPGPGDRGTNFFAGGPGLASSSATQLIDLSAAASAIDQGAVCQLSGYLGGFSSQGDNAVVGAYFGNSVSTNLGSIMIGPVTAADRTNVTGLLARTSTSDVPIGTRWVSVSITMTRLEGSYNDGYADNLSLVLTKPRPALDIRSSGAQTVLEWPTNATAFRLETTTNLPDASSWLEWPGIVSVSGSNFSVTVTPNESRRFFRLKSPEEPFQ